MKLVSEEAQQNIMTPKPTLTTALSNGFLIGLLEVFWWVSLLSLFFAGELADYFGRAAVFLVLGSFISASILAYKSSWKGVVGHSQDVPAAILVVATAEIVRSVSAETTTPALFATVIATIGIASIVYGIVSYLLGYFKLGNIVRLLPYPVVAGFLGGTGWLLLMGGIAASLPANTSGSLLQPQSMQYWVPAVVTAIIIYLVSLRFRHPLLVPIMIVLAAFCFFAITAVLGMPLQQLTNDGWLIGALPAGSQIQLLSVAEFRGIQWSAILDQSGAIIVLAFASVIAMLLNSSGLELTVQTDLDNNNDLKMTGFANILAGLTGGYPSYLGLSWSVHNSKDKTEIPLSGVVAVIVAGILLWSATQVLAYMPRLVTGAMVIFMGLGFLHDWVLTPAKRLPRLEYAMLLLILAAVAIFGLLEGVAAGLFMAVLLFVFSYGRVNVVRYKLSGVHQKSRVTRLAEQRDHLQAVGEQTQILQLHGYVFFGTATSLLDQVRDTIAQPNLRYLLLDFERVSGVDSTAILSVAKMQQNTLQRGIELVLTGISAETQTQLEQDIDIDAASNLHLFETLDKALQWVEDRQLRSVHIDPLTQQPPLEEQLQAILPPTKSIEPLLALMEEQELADGEHIIRQGDEPSDMYFVKEGFVTAQLERDDGTIVRLETMGVGRVVGELGFYLNQPRTAAVVSTGKTTVYKLSKERLKTIEKENPDAASTLHQLIVHLLSDRVTHLVGIVNVLQQ